MRIRDYAVPRWDGEAVGFLGYALNERTPDRARAATRSRDARAPLRRRQFAVLSTISLLVVVLTYPPLDCTPLQNLVQAVYMLIHRIRSLRLPLTVLSAPANPRNDLLLLCACNCLLRRPICMASRS